MQLNPYQSPGTESVVEERRGWRLGHGESGSAIGNAIRWTCAAALYPGVVHIFGWPQSGYWIFGAWIAAVAGVRWFAGRTWAVCASAVLGAGFGAVVTLLLSIANPMSGEDWLRSVAVGAAWGLYPFAVAELVCFRRRAWPAASGRQVR